ncbi:MAG: hypothetical protein O3C30_09220, partial [Proteobacteria bacterium]|nr:hypothetical protein [Pseudomonadota bacterium]
RRFQCCQRLGELFLRILQPVHSMFIPLLMATKTRAVTNILPSNARPLDAIFSLDHKALHSKACLKSESK